MQLTVKFIKGKIGQTLRKNGVRKAALFGSIVTGGFTAKSDVDILVELGQGKSLLDLIGLEFDLEEKLGRKVDLITYNSIHPLLKKSILENQVRIL